MDIRKVRHHFEVPMAKADRIVNQGMGMLIANDPQEQVQAGDELDIAVENSNSPIGHVISDNLYTVVEVCSMNMQPPWRAVLIKYLRPKED